MNEVRFGRLWRRALLLAPLAPWAVFGTGCGGAATVEGPGNAGASAGANVEQTGGASGSGLSGSNAGGSAAASGQGDDSAGSAGAQAGAGGAAGYSAGAGGVSGSGSGASAGSGGASGSAGMGLAGNSAVCHATPAQPCAGGPITIARACIAEASASVNTMLPIDTCRLMCESMFTFSCRVSSVQQTTITVLCTTGCPASHE